MIKIKNKPTTNAYCTFNAIEFMGEKWKQERSTFYGKVGSFEGYFLITYDSVIYLNNPKHTWPHNPGISPYQWVDLEVKEV